MTEIAVHVPAPGQTEVPHIVVPHIVSFAPEFVVDARTPEWRDLLARPRLYGRLRLWMWTHDIWPRYTYRLEVYRLDTLFARVYQYARTPQGVMYCRLDHEHGEGGCQWATRKPFEVVVSEMPPALDSMPPTL